jgi:MYXO-CTERM domain-containing protein
MGRSVAALLVVVFLTLSPATLRAATLTAESCSREHVGAVVAVANDGDTVVIPEGTCVWTKTLDTCASAELDQTFCNADKSGKYLTLQGAGADKTVIVDGLSKDLFPNLPHLIRWNLSDGGPARITGITFRGGSIADEYNKGMVVIGGSSSQFRIDSCKFVPTQTSALLFQGDVRGVVDHNFFDLSAAHGYGVYVFHGSWNVPGSNYGDASWADADSLGTDRALFFEDNVFFNDQSKHWQYYAVDGWMGARVVYRHNTFQATVWANHGTESGGRQRGMRQFEVYGNTFDWDLKGNAFPSVIGSRSGVGVVFDNVVNITNGQLDTVFDVTNLRVDKPFAPWGQCGQAGVWDENADPSGYRCIDQVGTGQSILLSGDSPTPVGFPKNAVAPTYAWNNTLNGAQKKIASRRPGNVVANRDYFDLEKPEYTAYVYPHPLVGGAAPSDAGADGAAAGGTLNAGTGGSANSRGEATGDRSAGGADASGLSHGGPAATDGGGCGCRTADNDPRGSGAGALGWLVWALLAALRRPRRGANTTRGRLAWRFPLAWIPGPVQSSQIGFAWNDHWRAAEWAPSGSRDT